MNLLDQIIPGKPGTRTVNPWKWQDNLGYAQAVEVRNNKGTLYCAGQAAIDADGRPVAGDMAGQITRSLHNLEQVIRTAGYQPSQIVRLNFYTTSIPDFFAAYGTAINWMMQHQVIPSSTLLEVSALAFPELTIEIEATLAG